MSKVDIHKRDHVYVVKWFSSIVMIFSMALNSANIYPLNVYLGLLSSAGWAYVSIKWKDRALIILNALAVAIYLSGVLNAIKSIT